MAETETKPNGTSKPAPFPEIVALYFPLDGGGVGVNCATSIRAKENNAEFKEHPQEVEVWVRPRGQSSRPIVQHYKIHKAQIRYIEYAE